MASSSKRGIRFFSKNSRPTIEILELTECALGHEDRFVSEVVPLLRVWGPCKFDAGMHVGVQLLPLDRLVRHECLDVVSCES